MVNEPVVTQNRRFRRWVEQLYYIFLPHPVQGGFIKLRYTEFGDLIITREDDPRQIIDAMLKTGYNKEFCVAVDFSPEFISGLMEAGFLVMSAKITGSENQFFYILLPKLHLVRSVLFFENLLIKKSIRRHLNRYELRVDDSFNFILNRCLEVHGEDWLTPPLVDAIKFIRRMKGFLKIRPTSFALYREGKLVAGEFGIITGRVYTSYSGYYDESNAGTVQLIKTTEYLRDNGFAFFDLGMPLDYKSDLGARNISPEEFIKWFRGVDCPRS